MERILITGGTGLLGANLSAYFRRRYRVAATFRTHGMLMPGVVIMRMNIRHKQDVEQCFEKFQPTVVIHCAAETRVDYCVANLNLAKEVNVSGARRVAEATREHRARMVYVSSDAVYEGSAADYSENYETRPVNVYAETKLEGERAVIDVVEDALILRTNMFGWNAQDKLSLAEWILQGVKRGKTVPGFTDIVFSPLHVNHIAEIIDILQQKRVSGVFNLGAGDACSKFEFARMVCEVFHYNPGLILPCTSDTANFIASRSKNTSMNVEKLQGVLKKAPPSIRDGLEYLYQQQISGYAAELKMAALKYRPEHEDYYEKHQHQ